MPAHELRRLRPISHAQVSQDAADHGGQEMALLLGELDAALFYAGVCASLRHTGQVRPLLLVEPDPHMRLLAGCRVRPAADRAVELVLFERLDHAG